MTNTKIVALMEPSFYGESFVKGAFAFVKSQIVND